MTAAIGWGRDVGGKSLAEALDAAIGIVPTTPRPGPRTWMDRLYSAVRDVCLWPDGPAHVSYAYVRSGRVRTRDVRMTPDAAVAVVARYGGNVKRAADLEGVPRSTLRDLLRDAGVSMRPHQWGSRVGVSPEQARQRYDIAGRKLGAAARSLGISPTTLRNLLSVYGATEQGGAP